MDNSSVPVTAARYCALLLCALLLLWLHCCGCVGVAGVPVVLWLLPVPVVSASQYCILDAVRPPLYPYLVTRCSVDPGPAELYLKGQ